MNDALAFIAQFGLGSNGRLALDASSAVLDIVSQVTGINYLPNLLPRMGGKTQNQTQAPTSPLPTQYSQPVSTPGSSQGTSLSLPQNRALSDLTRSFAPTNKAQERAVGEVVKAFTKKDN